MGIRRVFPEGAQEGGRDRQKRWNSSIEVKSENHVQTVGGMGEGRLLVEWKV